MSSNALAAPLQRVRLFQGLSNEQRMRIARSAERVVYRPGETICSEGQSADAAILLVSSGAVTLEAATEAGVPIEPFSLIGEMAMVVDHLFAVTVVAREPVRAMKLTRGAMHRLILDDPTIADSLIAVLSGRLAEVGAQLRQVDDQVAVSLDRLGGAGAAAALARNHPVPVATMH